MAKPSDLSPAMNGHVLWIPEFGVLRGGNISRKTTPADSYSTMNNYRQAMSLDRQYHAENAAQQRNAGLC